jgi:CubicO group peptidase (beta-lactamase class C family)
MRTSPPVLSACQTALVLVAQPTAPAGQTTPIYFPPATGDWETVGAGESGWSGQRLDDVVTFARERQTTALLILQHGRILAEHYWDIGSPPLEPGGSTVYRYVGATAAGRPIEDVASVQKTVVGALVGIAVSKGLVNIDAPSVAILGRGGRTPPSFRRAGSSFGTCCRCRAAWVNLWST